MRKLIVLSALLLPASALAYPCPKGSNVPIGSDTTASSVELQQAQRLAQSRSASNTTQSVSLRNHYPH